MKKTTVAMLLAVCVPCAAQADYHSIGVGMSSCGTWTEVRRTNTAQMMQQWVFGFLSGVGWMNEDVFDPLNGVDAFAVLGWMDNYCKEHPLEKLSLAAGSFVLAHPK